MIKKCNKCEVKLECVNYLKNSSCWFNLKEGKGKVRNMKEQKKEKKIEEIKKATEKEKQILSVLKELKENAEKIYSAGGGNKEMKKVEKALKQSVKRTGKINKKLGRLV